MHQPLGIGFHQRFHAAGNRFVLTAVEGGLMQARAAAELSPFDDSVAVLRDHFDRLLAQGGGPDSAEREPEFETRKEVLP